jgi:hypothetical protein
MSDWKEAEDDGLKYRVKTLPNGARVHDNGGDFSAYDSRANYLGFCATEEEAGYIAERGFANQPEEACELSLWAAWNDATAHGLTVLQAPDGEQFIQLPGDVVLGAKKGRHGWDVRLIGSDELFDRYRDERYDVLTLTVAEKPYVLE